MFGILNKYKTINQPTLSFSRIQLYTIIFTMCKTNFMYLINKMKKNCVFCTVEIQIELNEKKILCQY